MPEQPQGSDSPYLASNPSGIGAVFFDKPKEDLMDIHLKNLEGIDKALEEKKTQQKAATAVAAKLLEYKNPDLNGIFPKDREELIQKGADVTSKMVKLLSMGKQDPTNPEWLSAYNDLNNAKQELATNIGVSKSTNKDYHDVGGKFATGELKDADPKYFADHVAKGVAMSLADRAASGFNVYEGIRKKTPDFKEAMQAYVGKLAKDAMPRTTTEIGDGGTAYYQHKIKENITPQQIDEISHSFRTMGELGKAFEDTWKEENATRPDMVKALRDKYQNEQPAIREQKAQDDYVKGYLEKELYRQQDEKTFKGTTEYGKEKLIWDRGAVAKEKDAWKGEAANVADVWNGKPGADKAFLHTPLDKKTYLSKQSIVTPQGLVERYVPTENSIIDVGYDNGKPYVITRETADAQSELNGGNKADNGGKTYFSSPRALTTFIYGKSANKVDLAFRGTGAMTQDGDYDTQKYSPTSKWINPPTGTPDVTSQQQPSWFDKNKTATKNKTSTKKKIGSVEYELKNVGQESLPLVIDKSSFDNLPKGTKYTKSDGKTYVKG